VRGGPKIYRKQDAGQGLAGGWSQAYDGPPTPTASPPSHAAVTARYLDLESWPRRGAFEFFRDYRHPHFNVCTSLEVGALLRWTRAAADVSFTLASLYLALRIANDYEPFRYRLESGRVRVHERLHAGSTALIGEERLAFV
jgi:chloramphenicol O-acetyltransferase